MKLNCLSIIWYWEFEKSILIIDRKKFILLRVNQLQWTTFFIKLEESNKTRVYSFQMNVRKLNCKEKKTLNTASESHFFHL